MHKTDGIGKENGSTEEKQSFKDGSICGYTSLHHLLSANLKPQLYQESRNRIGTVSKSAKLVTCVKQLSNVKEEVYGALDSFITWELEFPLITVKKALKILQNEQEWKRIIQVIKWMLSKGQRRTMGTYFTLLNALAEDERLEEAEELWVKLFSDNLESTPRIFFDKMISIYYHKDMHEKMFELLCSTII
ncbi:hypothetical protein ERO13_D02G121533v2 [Gossypium hirsutum]|nr:hypothetical protein ERO13_D02G121533v2 [Gossypium hirsutum]